MTMNIDDRIRSQLEGRTNDENVEISVQSLRALLAMCDVRAVQVEHLTKQNEKLQVESRELRASLRAWTKDTSRSALDLD